MELVNRIHRAHLHANVIQVLRDRHVIKVSKNKKANVKDEQMDFSRNR